MEEPDCLFVLVLYFFSLFNLLVVLLFFFVTLGSLLLKLHYLLLSNLLSLGLLWNPLLDVFRLWLIESRCPLALFVFLESRLSILFNSKHVIELSSIYRFVTCLELNSLSIRKIERIPEVAVQMSWAPHHLQVDLLHQLTEHRWAKFSSLYFFLEEWLKLEQLLNISVVWPWRACSNCGPFVTDEDVDWWGVLWQLCYFKLANVIHRFQVLLVVYIWPFFVVTLHRIVLFFDTWNAAYFHCLITFFYLHYRARTHEIDVFSCKSTIVQLSEVVWCLMISTNEYSQEWSSFFLLEVLTEVTESFELLWTFKCIHVLIVS